ncbi:hypothetical protein IMZ08_10935 [Bacillus luteolus]|uniref:Uncharacterized protein n=1 Tax=Litchfieldia luteola TaxID=682179 RepID=A0ABR9QJ99_9BACI|nr:hypothetical protein [Cytobacillus luteolus]MBE4908571.1 hypothetical protein [Cytobacillus luteolus]MBP1941426.1 putative membrane protein [Cytobacillus luteolus]
MTAREVKWGLMIVVIILLGYILPYTVLSNVTAWYGSFLLWTILAIAIIVINYFFTKNWGDSE